MTARVWRCALWSGKWTVTNGHTRYFGDDDLSEWEARLVTARLNRLELLVARAWSPR